MAQESSPVQEILLFGHSRAEMATGAIRCFVPELMPYSFIGTAVESMLSA